MSWHCIFTPDNIWWGGDYVVTSYFRFRQYLVREWLYRDIIFSLRTIFGERVIISWHYIFNPDSIWWGGILSWHYIFTPDSSWWGLILFWPYIFTPDNIWWRGDYIGTLHFHSWCFPYVWHWRWLYLNIFTIQVWLCSDTRVLSFTYIYSPHETWRLKWLYLSMMHFLLLKLSVSGGYVDGLYQQSAMKRNL